MRLALLLCLSVLPATGRSQAPTPGDCTLGAAEADIDIGDVQARLFNTGALFFGNTSQAAYEVPRGSGRLAMFASNLWVGGLVGSELRLTGASYQNFEYWPGPLNAGATLPNPTDCAPYDRIWKVSRADVETYIATGVGTPDLLQWPHDLGAPVLDGDGIPDNYNLAGGDQPAIWGDQTLWWVMNDVGNDHLASGTPPIGLEVQVTAFGLADGPEELTHATYYRYRLINRSGQPLDSAYVGIYSDPDLGDAADDFVGTDLLHAMGYVYNADNADGTGGGGTYGTPPPALGVQLLGTPAGLANGRDDDGDGLVDESGEQLGLTASSCWAKNNAFPLREPANAEERYNCLKGLWIDGTPMTEGGNGYQSPGPVTTFQFTGDPVTATYWSEGCPNNPCGPALPAGDRRMGQASGPFTLAAGGEETFEFAILFGQGTDHRNSVAALREAAVLSRSAYDSGTFEPHPVANSPQPSSVDDVQVQRPAPNPFAEGTTLRYTLSRPGHVRVALVDVLGREVAIVTDGAVGAGAHELQIDGRTVPTGVYVVRLRVDDQEVASIPVTVAR